MVYLTQYDTTYMVIDEMKGMKHENQPVFYGS
jgi:hypothetical protein